MFGATVWAVFVCARLTMKIYFTFYILHVTGYEGFSLATHWAQFAFNLGFIHIALHYGFALGLNKADLELIVGHCIVRISDTKTMKNVNKGVRKQIIIG